MYKHAGIIMILALAALIFTPLKSAQAQLDTDGDGMSDQWENLYPCVDALVGDSALDADSDTLSNLAEYVYESDPCNPDTDGDGLSDAEEISLGTLVAFWDSDLDGLPDGFEQLHLGEGLHPLISQAASDLDADGNFDPHEYWNGTDIWGVDYTGGPGCFFWGEGDGDGFIGPGDRSQLDLVIKGANPSYGTVIPASGETQELDMDGFIAVGDISIITQMIKMSPIDILPSRPALIERQSPSAPVVEVAPGDTVRLQVRLVNEAALRTPGFGIIFEIDPLSTGTASIFGGDGASGEGRYDISGAILDGVAQVVVRVDSPGQIFINARIPQCGDIVGQGRYCPAMEITPALTIFTESSDCRDVDGDGRWIDCIDYLTHPGPDCDDADPNNWSACATCLDGDTDGWFAGCDQYLTLTGPDCSDSDPNNWTACSTCLDNDSDNSYVGCNAYLTISGPDCRDTDPNNWASCGFCRDDDLDLRYRGCDAYVTILGPDCDDLNPELWDACDTCVDNDVDGYYLLCNLYNNYPGPDCDDSDINNWEQCASCADLDGDGWFAGCDTYYTIKGPDCDDADLNNWTKCSTCVDADGDGFYAGCNSYQTLLGPDRNDGNVSYQSYFIITVSKPVSSWTTSLYTNGNTDTSAINYPGLIVRWVNPKVRLQDLSVTSDGAAVTFTIRNISTDLKRIWMFAWARDAELGSAPRLVNNQGDHVFIIGPIESGGERTYTLSASGFGPGGYKFYIDFVQPEPTVSFASDRADPDDNFPFEIYTGDSVGGHITRVSNEPAAVYSAGPFWSPAGEWIGYLRGGWVTCQDGATITTLLRPQAYIIHPDGSNQRWVSEGSFITGYFSFNPSGTVIAYDCRPDCTSAQVDICTYNLKTGERNVIFSGAGFFNNVLTTPRWAPNGQYMVMMAQDAATQNEMWLYSYVNAETGAPIGTLKYFTGSAPILANNYYWLGQIITWAWGPDSQHVALTTRRYLCWCGSEASSQNVNCSSPSKPANCYWAYFNSATTYPRNNTILGIGIVNFTEVLTATQLPVWMSLNRLGGVLAWPGSVSGPNAPYFREDGRRLYFDLVQNGTLSYLKYIKLNGYALDGATQYYYIPSTDLYYNRTPALFPPVLTPYFPVTP